MNNTNLSITGKILRIERASIHDGSGLRTVVFFKGCPLSCSWCSTPESKQFGPEKGYAAELCKACVSCIDACPGGAISLDWDNQVVITDKSLCNSCFSCGEVCPSHAIKAYGKEMTVSDVMDEVKKDEIFYYHSGGGITLSGGEPFSQSNFAAALLEESKNIGINTAVESCLYANHTSIEKLLPWLDTLYVDLKHMDGVTHKEWTGQDNELILGNLVRVGRGDSPPSIIVRVPLVPGFNDSDENLLATLQFCKGLSNLKCIEVLPYHRLGIETYRYLDLDYSQCRDIIPPTAEHLSERTAFLKNQNSGIPIVSGSGFNEV